MTRGDCFMHSYFVLLYAGEALVAFGSLSTTRTTLRGKMLDTPTLDGTLLNERTCVNTSCAHDGATQRNTQHLW